MENITVSLESFGDFISFLEDNEILMTEFRERLDARNATLVSRPMGGSNLRRIVLDAQEGLQWQRMSNQLDLWTNTASRCCKRFIQSYNENDTWVTDT